MSITEVQQQQLLIGGEWGNARSGETSGRNTFFRSSRFGETARAVR